jgi:curved DNA-binding protein CbpA
MKGRPTLYELLGVLPEAPLAEIKTAFRSEVNALEAQRGALKTEVFAERMQMLRLACDTLTDAVARSAYDAKRLSSAAHATGGAAAPSLALAMKAEPHGADAQADALAMRADALAMRADAMLLRARVENGPMRGGELAQGALTGVKHVVRAIGLLVVVGVVAFGITRCASGGSGSKRMAIEANATEQSALQEYFQAHGVRPANMTELQLLDAARRRNEIEQRQNEQRKRNQEQELARFEEDARRQGEQVSRELQRQEENGRQRAEQVRMLKDQAEQLKLEADLASNEPDRRRLELRRKQTLDQINRL